MYKKYTSVESRNTFYYEGISFLLESGGREGSRVLNSNHAEAEAKLTGAGPGRQGAMRIKTVAMLFVQLGNIYIDIIFLYPVTVQFKDSREGHAQLAGVKSRIRDGTVAGKN